MSDEFDVLARWTVEAVQRLGPDHALPAAIDGSGKVRGIPVAVVSRSALSTVLRRGVTGAREIGGNELFDVRTRLQQTVRFV